MSIRKCEFITGEFYHVYNRGVDKRTVFEDGRDFFKFFEMIELFNQDRSCGSVKEYQYPKNLKHGGLASVLVEIVAFCFLPNHYHLILRQKVDGGISKFMQKIGTGYTMYFNKKNERSGSLFQGKFKAKHVEGRSALEYLSVYVNLNFKVHNLMTNKNEEIRYGGEKYRSSFLEYVKRSDGKKRCVTNHVLKLFNNDQGKYEKYANRQISAMTDVKVAEKNQKKLFIVALS